MKKFLTLILIIILSCDKKPLPEPGVSVNEKIMRKQSPDTIVINNLTLINNWGDCDTLYAEYDNTGKLIKVILNSK